MNQQMLQKILGVCDSSEKNKVIIESLSLWIAI